MKQSGNYSSSPQYWANATWSRRHPPRCLLTVAHQPSPRKSPLALITAGLFGLTLLAAADLRAASLPGQTIFVNGFSTTNEATAYFHDYGDAAFTNVFSPDDANGNTNSGSLLIEEEYGVGHPQGAYRYNLATPIGLANTITNLQFDIKVDTNSALDKFGSASYFQLAIRDQGGNYVSLFQGNVGVVATNNGWRHISFGTTGTPLLAGTVTNITAIELDPYDSNYTNTQSPSSLTLMHIDNIKFVMPYPPDSIVVINTFDTNQEALNYTLDYGSAGLSPGGLGDTNGCQFATDDANGDTNSGSMLILEAYSSTNFQGSYRWILPTALTNADTFTNLEFDIKVDPTSALDQYGSASYFQLAIRDQSFAYVALFQGSVGPVSTNNGWRHISVSNNGNPLGALEPVTSLQAIQIDPYDSNYTNAQDANVLTKMYIDNIIFRKAPTSVKIPPPTVSVEKVARGLNLFAGGSGAYDRENIRTLNNTASGGQKWSWVGNGSTPVTYSFTIGEYPSVNGFQTHLILTPGTPTESGPDYGEANVIMMDLQRWGGAQWIFRYKTNQPGGNSQLYGAGTIAVLIDPAGMLGTWQLQFVNDTNVTMISPGNVMTNFNIPADVAALFADPISVFLGVQPNSAGGVGDKVLITDFKVQGINSTATFEDNFVNDTTYPSSGPPSTLDTDNKWFVAAAFPGGVLSLQPSDYPLWVNWTLPAENFMLQTNSVLVGGTWSTNSVPPPVTIGATERTLLSTNDLPSGQSGFFRLANPGF